MQGVLERGRPVLLRSYRARRRDTPCNMKNQETWECNAKESRGRPQSPLVASAEAKSPCNKKDQHRETTSPDAGRSRSSGATMCKWLIKQLGALLREREVTTAALKALRCSALVGRDWVLLHNWSHDEPLGRCPKPHKERCPLTLQGALPLDPFWRPGLVALP